MVKLEAFHMPANLFVFVMPSYIFSFKPVIPDEPVSAQRLFYESSTYSLASPIHYLQLMKGNDHA